MEKTSIILMGLSASLALLNMATHSRTLLIVLNGVALLGVALFFFALSTTL